MKRHPRLVAAPFGCAVVMAIPASAQTQSQPLSTSLGMVVFPAKGQTAQQQAAQQQKLDLFKKGFSACLESKGYTVK